MRTYPSIEKKSTLLSLPITDLLLLLSLLVGLVLLGSILSLLFPLSRYYYLGSLLVVIILYGLIRYANRYGHPAYLQAFLSFYFKQPRKITTFPLLKTHEE